VGGGAVGTCRAGRVERAGTSHVGRERADCVGGVDGEATGLSLVILVNYKAQPPAHSVEVASRTTFCTLRTGRIRTSGLTLMCNLFITAPHTHLCLYSIFFPNILY